MSLDAHFDQHTERAAREGPAPSLGPHRHRVSDRARLQLLHKRLVRDESAVPLQRMGVSCVRAWGVRSEREILILHSRFRILPARLSQKDLHT